MGDETIEPPQPVIGDYVAKIPMPIVHPTLRARVTVNVNTLIDVV